MVKVNCDVGYRYLYKELESLLGEFYSRDTIVKACKYLKGNGVVYLSIKNYNYREDLDKICINELRILEGDGKKEIMDIEFEVFDGNLIPGYFMRTIIPKNKNLPAKCITKKECSPLITGKTLVFKTVESVKYGSRNSRIHRDKYLYGLILNEGNVALEA